MRAVAVASDDLEALDRVDVANNVAQDTRTVLQAHSQGLVALKNVSVLLTFSTLRGRKPTQMSARRVRGRRVLHAAARAMSSQ